MSFPGLDAIKFEFVNIREQCAWVHADDPKKATAKAIALTTAGVSRVRGEISGSQIVGPVERSVLILGGGKAATISKDIFEKQGIPVEYAKKIPEEIVRTIGMYQTVSSDGTRGGQALILAPRDDEEAAGYLDAFGSVELRPRVLSHWGGVETHRPGVYFCDPALSSELVGRAAAARSIAWLGRLKRDVLVSAYVDSARCRACGTCADICEYGAPELVGDSPLRTAQIDPVICLGCGTCAAHCPSDAISLRDGESDELKNVLLMILAVGG
jgi:heterodisulfide reductase subunit A-like polyferredoxin